MIRMEMVSVVVSDRLLCVVPYTHIFCLYSFFGDEMISCMMCFVCCSKKKRRRLYLQQKHKPLRMTVQGSFGGDVGIFIMLIERKKYLELFFF